MSITVRVTNFEYFLQLYTKELEKEVLARPDEYVWRVGEAPLVASKMTLALACGTAAFRDSRPIRRVAGRLKIPFTRAGLMEYLKDGAPKT